MTRIRYGRAGYGRLAAIRWHVGRVLWLICGKPYPGPTPLGVT